MARAHVAAKKVSVEVYLERGAKRTFAGAIEWPGWCRSAKDESTALDAMASYGPRYARVLRGTRLTFAAPADASGLVVVERLDGDATTDFGAPSREPSADRRPIGEADLRRLRSILRATWKAFDAAVEGAEGVSLRKGPRGGGRELDAIVRHVLEADGGYLRMLGHTLDTSGADDRAARTRAEILDVLAETARHGVPPSPRGGRRWSPRYFVRRSAWHVLDHAWEIEDRSS